MSYYKDEEGIVYYEAYESPSAVYSIEEWATEKERLTIGLQKQIDTIQREINTNSSEIKIEESYPKNVKNLIQIYNAELPDTEDLETQKQEKQNLLDEIINL